MPEVWRCRILPPPSFRLARSGTPGSRHRRRARLQQLRRPDRPRARPKRCSRPASRPASRFFDTADIYGGSGGSEEAMGAALEGRRDEYVLATKFGMEMRGAEGVPDVPRGSREYIRWAVEGSLRRLRTDRIDLYQLHEPDPETPIAETLRALDELVREGVVSRDRLLELQRRPARGGRPGRPRGGPRPLRHPAERIQPARARDRGRGGAGMRAPRRLDPPLLPARHGPAHRQVPARRGGARRAAASRPPSGPAPTPSSTSSRRSRPTPRRAGWTSSTSRSPASRPSPPSPR